MKLIIRSTVYFWGNKLRHQSRRIFVFQTFVCSVLLVLMTCVLSASPAQAQQSTASQSTASKNIVYKKVTKKIDAQKSEPSNNLFDQVSDELSGIWNKGEDELFIAGHSYHNRARYAPQDIARFNEQNTGLGWARTRYSAGVLDGQSGQSSGLYLMGFSSSIRDTQWNLGYLHKWHSPSWAGLQVAGGYTALLLSRPDVVGGVPVPVILPVGSLDTRYVSLELTYFPPINLAPAAQGDVWFLFGRVRW